METKTESSCLYRGGKVLFYLKLPARLDAISKLIRHEITLKRGALGLKKRKCKGDLVLTFLPKNPTGYPSQATLEKV